MFPVYHISLAQDECPTYSIFAGINAFSGSYGTEDTSFCIYFQGIVQTGYETFLSGSSFIDALITWCYDMLVVYASFISTRIETCNTLYKQAMNCYASAGTV